MRIQLASVLVDDQDKALKFYTEVLGFVKKTEIPMGESTWLTVVSPEQPNGMELVLEPTGFLPARMYQKSLFEAGTPAIALASDDVELDFERLKGLGVTFRGGIEVSGPVKAVLLEDTCGNLVNLYQATGSPV